MSDRSAMHCDAHGIYRCRVCEEVVEQARLLDISATREAKLLARIAELEKVAENAVIVCKLTEKSSMIHQLLERPLEAAGYLGGGG